MSWLLSPSSATKMTPKLSKNACMPPASTRRDEHRGSGESVVSEIGKRAVGVLERIGHDGWSNGDLRRQGEQFLAVASCVRCDTAQLTLFEQMRLVLQSRNVAQVDARHRERPASIECCHRDRDELTRGREQD